MITAEQLANLDDSELYDLLHRVEGEVAARTEKAFITALRVAVKEIVERENHENPEEQPIKYDEVTTVIFHTMDFDNGTFYYAGHAALTTRDAKGQTDSFDVDMYPASNHNELDGHLSDISRTQKIDEDDEECLYELHVDLKAGNLTHASAF